MRHRSPLWRSRRESSRVAGERSAHQTRILLRSGPEDHVMRNTKALTFGLALAAAAALVPQTASARGWHGGWHGGGWGWGAAALGAGLAAGALAAPYYG